MTTMIKKFLAALMMGLVFLSPMSSSALAAPKGDRHHQPRQMQQMEKRAPKMGMQHDKHHDRHGVSHAPRHHYQHRDSKGSLVGGLLLGIILSAAIADANAN